MYYLGKLLIRFLFWCVGRPALFVFEFMGMKREPAAQAAGAVVAVFLVLMAIIIPIAQVKIFRALRAGNEPLGPSPRQERSRRAVQCALLLMISLLAIVMTFSALLVGFVVPIWPIVPLFLLSGAVGIAAAAGELVQQRWRWPVRTVTTVAVVFLVLVSSGL
jgi:hypothetical protein